ncbi:uncharacterized protein LOC129596668 isoform X2 [Paramacrobiotus metropolitanus]|uniref:uncharacterized protein LOC129596668 isoform X2 n=1 Tax=Paramacrobiotus metropolitanus TaxID=2943436 RepID=UPI002445F262|nr:uncharacterized protein LOC129596668 isoform X2 [Paramacrobiotus metropolitanus]
MRMYLGNVIAQWQYFIHTAIALSRFCALIFPVQYRQRHNTRVAIVACSLCGILAHLGSGPFVVVDWVLYRRPETIFGCFPIFGAVNAVAWSYSFSVISFIAISVVLALYPVVFYIRRKRQQILRQIRPPNPQNAGVQESSLPASSGPSNNQQAKPESNAFLLLTILTILDLHHK